MNLKETLQETCTGSASERRYSERERNHKRPAALVTGSALWPFQSKLVRGNHKVTVEPDFKLSALVQLHVAALKQEAGAGAHAGPGRGSNDRAFVAADH